MVNYCGRFIQNLTTLTKPLRELNKAKVPWEWGPAQDQAFKDKKAVLSAETTLVYFDPARHITLAVDAVRWDSEQYSHNNSQMASGPR